ncbi:MAG TPA: hypothetical protein VNL35_05035 [Chloroflexota bacterium]|nr:hypothetical protein [Chloroflexota bacterium]
MMMKLPVGGRPREEDTWGGTNRKALIAVEAFVGLSAFAGGVALMLGPKGSILPLSTSLLDGTPFADYFIPGALLALVIGGGMLGAALLLWRRRPSALTVAMASGAALMIFEIVEFSIIGFNPLQVVYGGLGAVILWAANHRWLAMGPRHQALGSRLLYLHIREDQHHQSTSVPHGSGRGE